MSIKGSPNTHFLRALETGNIQLVRTAALELPRIDLADALGICMVFRTDPDLYERAAVRWLGRFGLEARDVKLFELEQAAVALAAIPGHPEDAYDYLNELCAQHGIRLGRPPAAPRLSQRRAHLAAALTP